VKERLYYVCGQEIVAALKGGCRIIPITDEAFLWPDEDTLPMDIRAVTRYQAIPSVFNDTFTRLRTLEPVYSVFYAVND